MRRLRVPTYDWELVQHLAKVPNPTTIWGRSSGRPGKFKKSVTKMLKIEQDTRCAYCGSYLFEKSPHRDHVAPKEQFPDWTFRPENLVLACYACNTDRKKVFNPVARLNGKYRRCVFNFVHPYFDNPTHHISFKGDIGGVVISSLSPKGQQTIDLFDLSNPERTKQRAMDTLSAGSKSRLHGKWLKLFVDVELTTNGLRLIPR